METKWRGVWRRMGSLIFILSHYFKGVHICHFPLERHLECEDPMEGFLYVWTTVWRKILACINFRKRSYSIVVLCCMCQFSGETVDHLCFIVMWPINCGALSSDLLGSTRFYRREWFILCLAGVIEWVNILWTFGTWFWYAWCGSYDKNAIGECLRMRRVWGISF